VASADENPASGRSSIPERGSPHRRRRWLRWLLGILGGLVLVSVAAVAVFFVVTRNPDPGAFYDPPEDISSEPGTILREEPFDDGLPAGARGWKIL
jgi:hypothetical protein